MKFVAMRFLVMVLAIIGLTSCTDSLPVRQVERGCALYTSAKTAVVRMILSAEGLFNDGEENGANPDEVQKPVTKQLKYKNQEGVVEVVMKVDEKGNWKVVNMAATNEELAKYVLTKLKDYNQTSHKAVGQVVKYRFVFKKQV